MREDYLIHSLPQSEVELAVRLFSATSILSVPLFNRALGVLWDKAVMKGYDQIGNKCLFFYLPVARHLSSYAYLHVGRVMSDDRSENGCLAFVRFSSDGEKPPLPVHWWSDDRPFYYVMFDEHGRFGEYIALPHLNHPVTHRFSATSLWVPGDNRVDALSIKAGPDEVALSEKEVLWTTDKPAGIKSYRKWWTATLMATDIADNIFGKVAIGDKGRLQVINDITGVILDRSEQYELKHHRLKKLKTTFD